ncbi:MAG: reverse transcriptase domain-containing protein, partial [Phycisphaerales bacterium]
MKRVAGLFEQVVEWENLVLATRKAARGKGASASVQRFGFAREIELVRLAVELSAGTYRPGPFRTHYIALPKRRLISAAPFADRVVHHAIMNVLEPVLDARMHPSSFACRKGKGTGAASRCLQRFMARAPFFAHCDIVRYFPSIDHELLKQSIRSVLKDQRLAGLIDAIIDGSNPQEGPAQYFEGDSLFTPWERRRGLPIGNLTSQWFANWYLTGLDRLLAALPGVVGYVRYCDDFVVLGKARGDVAGAVDHARQWLRSRRLQLHEARADVRSSVVG